MSDFEKRMLALGAVLVGAGAALALLVVRIVAEVVR